MQHAGTEPAHRCDPTRVSYMDLEEETCAQQPMGSGCSGAEWGQEPREAAAEVMGGPRQHQLSWEQAGLARGLIPPGICLLSAAVQGGCHLTAL